MESLQHVKSRIRGVTNVGQITKAMEVVSSTKMRKAQEVLLASRPYAYKALELLLRLLPHASKRSPLVVSSHTGSELLVVVTSDKGLTGAFNAQVLRRADEVIKEFRKQGRQVVVSAVGKKAAVYAEKQGFSIQEVFTKLGDAVRAEDVGALSAHIIEGYLSGAWSSVHVISVNFVTTLKQEVVIRQLLPVDIAAVSETIKNIIPTHGRYADLHEKTLDVSSEIEYIFEPSADVVITELFRHLVQMELYHLMLEANASEHSARRVAMKTAADNADDLRSRLTLTFNKARQAQITKEIIEITSTEAAMKS